MELTIKELEATKLDIKPGDTLAVTIKSDDVTGEALGVLKEQLSAMFPKVRVLLFGIGLHDDVKFNVITEPKDVNVCSDCNCGKKSRFEGDLVYTPEELDKVLGINTEGENNES